MVYLRTSVIVLILIVFSSSVALSQSGVPWVGWIESANYEEASVMIRPDGSGFALTNARVFGGEVVDASITVGLIDNTGSPVANFPREDIWLETETEATFSCFYSGHHGFPADMNTDYDGVTVFTLPLTGGGCHEGPLWVYLNGSRAMLPDYHEHPAVPLRFNSPDINADGLVNLIDAALFAGDFFGAYQYRSDFFWDGVLNLTDLGFMSLEFGATCE